MRSRIVVYAVAMMFLVLGLVVVGAQQSDDDVRGVFLSSRPKTTNTNAPPRRRHTTPGNTNTSSATVKNTNTKPANLANSNTKFTNSNQNSGRTTTSQAIALGYTLYMRDVNGRAVRVEPNREFHNGDRIRISLEPNIDGYLYVFHTEGDGQPEMIYPDARLEGGDNWIEAHVPIDVPSTVETDERLRWFQFYGNAATEHLYVVVTREPLADVPFGDTLVNLCTTSKDKCPWHPSVEVWMRTQQAAKADVK